MDPTELWKFLPKGYALTVAIETPILLVGLSARHRLSRRLVAGLWLTACTYPIVILALPLLITDRLAYVIVAELFAHIAECVLFWAAFDARLPWDRKATTRDMLAVLAANFASFLAGQWLTGQGLSL